MSAACLGLEGPCRCRTARKRACRRGCWTDGTDWTADDVFENFADPSNTVRKSIARVLTVINQKQRQNLREFYKKSKCELRVASCESASTVYLLHSIPTSCISVLACTAAARRHISPSHLPSHTTRTPLTPDLPLDLRYKKTRAIRRRLTHNEKTAITEKQHKRQIHFPQRKYALKA